MGYGALPPRGASVDLAPGCWEDGGTGWAGELMPWLGPDVRFHLSACSLQSWAGARGWGGWAGLPARSWEFMSAWAGSSPKLTANHESAALETSHRAPQPGAGC